MLVTWSDLTPDMGRNRGSPRQCTGGASSRSSKGMLRRALYLPEDSRAAFATCGSIKAEHSHDLLSGDVAQVAASTSSLNRR